MGRYSAIGCVLFISHLFHSGLSLARAWSSQVVVCVRVCARAQLCPTLCNPLDWSPPGSSIHGIFQARIQNGLPFPPPGDLPDPGIKPTSPLSAALQADSLPAELLGPSWSSHGRWQKHTRDQNELSKHF